MGTSASKVRATSLICLLGLGLGLGSLFIYKICSRFFYSSPPNHPPRRRKITRHFSDSDQTTPETPSDSGISTYSLSSMGNNVSDATPNISPNSPYTSVLYTSSDGIRFRGIREEAEGRAGDDHDFEMVPDPGKKRGKAEGRPEDLPLLTSRPKVPGQEGRNSKYSRPLTINIVPETEIANKDKYSISSPDSDLDLGKTPPERRNSAGTESIGAYSLLPNYSPASLHEKNARLPEDGDFFQSSLSGGGNDEQDGWSLVSAPKTPTSPSESDLKSKSPASENTKELLNNNLEEDPIENFSSVKHSTPHSKKTKDIVSPCVGPIVENAGSAMGRILSEEGSLKRKSFVKHSQSSDNSSPLELSPQRLALRRYNSDCSETGSGIVTPDSELFDDGDVGVRTAVSMSQLESELTDVQREMEEMYDTINKLNSKENMDGEGQVVSPSQAKAKKAWQLLRKLKLSPLDNSSSRSSRSRSTSLDRDLKDSVSGSFRSSFTHNSSAEYMWDHKSDLGTDKSGSQFISMRPTFNQTGSTSNETTKDTTRSPMLAHLRASHLSSPSSMDSTAGDLSLTSGVTSISDIYIDDEYSGLADSEHSSPSRRADDASSAGLSPIHSEEASITGSPSMGSPERVVTTENNNSIPSNSEKSDLDKSENQPITSIGSLVNLEDYVAKEWRGTTSNAETVRQGYASIPSKLEMNNLRRVRGDNYCALRGTLFQLLRQNLPIAKTLGPLHEVVQRLKVFRKRQYVYLQNWSFGGRLQVAPSQVYEKVLHCVNCLYNQIDAVSALKSDTEREDYLLNLLNSSEETDVELMEAVKVLMMLNALRLHEASSSGEEVPVFVWLLFARDTSSDPERFFINHLNCVGDTGGLEQVEMLLLSHTLGVGIQVVRPSSWGQEDYLTCYKEEANTSLELIQLIAEDDRHYNVLLP